MHAQYPDRKPIERGLKLIMSRQQANGEWLSEAIEGVFNRNWFVFSVIMMWYCTEFILIICGCGIV